jgi:drug/metabolite transporter (DMT)-like permease
MAKNKKQKDKWLLWFVIGLISYLMIAPNTTIIRILLGDINPLEFTFIRSMIIVVISLPFVLLAVHKFNKRNLLYTFWAGICMTIAVISMTYAVKYSSASYVLILSLISPIILVILSSRIAGDKINLRAAAGVALAAAGAMIVVVTPLFITGNTSAHFYPLSTILMLVNGISFTLGIIFSRKSNESGMPLFANAGLMSTIILVVSFVGMITLEGWPNQIGHFSITAWIGIFYSAIIVVFLARVMNIASYERIGAATTSGLNYLGEIVAITIPVIILHEKVSSTLAIGGILVLIGVYVTERHRLKFHKYIHRH